MFAIQWGLIISCILSSITGISGVFNPEATMDRFFGEGLAPSGPIFSVNFRMLFASLIFLYSLNLLIAVYCPFVSLAYMLCAGNMIRVFYIVLVYMVNPEKMALLAFAEGGKMLKLICVVQTVLAIVIGVCAYISSGDADYIAYAAELAAAASDADFGPYTYFVYTICFIGMLTRLSQIFKPTDGIARLLANGKDDLPSDKGDLVRLEFAAGFYALNLVMLWVFVIAMLYLTPVLTPVVYFFTGLCGLVVVLMAYAVVNAAELRMAVLPLAIFLAIISIMFGASVLALLLI